MSTLAVVRRLLSSSGPRISRAAVPGQTGVMVALPVPPFVAASLALAAATLPQRVPQTELHLTLAFLGKAEELTDPPALLAVCASVAATTPPLAGALNGYGTFVGVDDAGDPYWIHADLPALPAFRSRLVLALAGAGFAASERHGFTAHITLAYLPTTTLLVPRLAGLPRPVRFDRLVCAIGGEWESYPLGGRESVLIERGALPRRPREPAADAPPLDPADLSPDWTEDDAPDAEEQAAAAAGMRTLVGLAGAVLYSFLRQGALGHVTERQRHYVRAGLDRARAQYGAQLASPARVDAYAAPSLGNLRSLADRLADGEISEAQAAAWTAYEGNAAFHAFAAEQHALALARGLTLAAWRLDPAVREHCAGCLALAASSPYPIAALPSLPGDGDTECGDGCHCAVEYFAGEAA